MRTISLHNCFVSIVFDSRPCVLTGDYGFTSYSSISGFTTYNINAIVILANRIDVIVILTNRIVFLTRVYLVSFNCTSFNIPNMD